MNEYEKDLYSRAAWTGGYLVNAALNPFTIKDEPLAPWEREMLRETDLEAFVGNLTVDQLIAEAKAFNYKAAGQTTGVMHDDEIREVKAAADRILVVRRRLREIRNQINEVV